MSLAFDLLAWLLTLTGIGFVLVGSAGILRMPDLFTRLHAAGMTDTMGAGFLLAGMAVYVVEGMVSGDTGMWTVLVRLVLVYGFLFFTSPIASHALSRAALDAGELPWRPGAGTAGPGSGTESRGGAATESRTEAGTESRRGAGTESRTGAPVGEEGTPLEVGNGGESPGETEP